MNATLKNQILNGLLMAAAVAAALPMPELAIAQDLSTSVTKVTTGIASMPNLIAGACYIGGAIMTGAGLLKLKAHGENPANAPLSHGLGRVAAGASLIALPGFAGWALASLGTNGTDVTAHGLGKIIQ